jgi:hypothetical protein
MERVGEITEIAEGAKRRAKWAMIGALIIVLIGAAIGIGSLVTNVAIRDIRQNNDAAICRSNISGAYTSLESDRDNAFVLGLLAQGTGDTETFDAKKALVTNIARTLDQLPPRQEAYAEGVTIDGVAYAACSGSVWPPPTATPPR